MLDAKRLARMGVLALAVTLAFPAWGALVARDQFLIGTNAGAGEYLDSAQLHGQGPTGGTVAGFTGNWTAEDAGDPQYGNYTLSSTGLDYQAGSYALVTTGGSVQYVRTASGNSAKQASRSGDNTTGGAVVYGSVLLKADDWTGNSVAVSVDANAGSWITMGIDSGFAYFENSGAVGPALAVDQAHLLVFRIEETGDGGGEDWSFWVNPTTLNVEPSPTDTGSTSSNNVYNGGLNFDLLAFDAGFNQNDLLWIDEVRVGESWAEVVPVTQVSAGPTVPEPLTASLAVLGGVALLARRRHKA